MSRKWTVLSAIVVLAVALVFAITFRGALPLADATVRFRAGQVWVGSRPFDGTIVRQGAIVRTGENGRIDLDVGPSVAVEAGANTEFTVPLGSGRAFEASLVRGGLLVSTIDAQVIVHTRHDVVTATPGTTASLAPEGDGVRVCVLRGATSVAAAGTCAIVEKGRVLRRGEIPSAERLALETLHAAARLR